jgi:hypothetical protein
MANDFDPQFRRTANSRMCAPGRDRGGGLAGLGALHRHSADPTPGGRLEREETPDNDNQEAGGRPRFLHTVLECVAKRCEILGLNAPIEARIQGRLSIEDLRAIMEDDAPIEGESDEETEGGGKDRIQ